MRTDRQKLKINLSKDDGPGLSCVVRTTYYRSSNKASLTFFMEYDDFLAIIGEKGKWYVWCTAYSLLVCVAGDNT